MNLQLIFSASHILDIDGPLHFRDFYFVDGAFRKLDRFFKHRITACNIQKIMSRVMSKPTFCICENKDAEAVKLISAFVFALFYFLNPKSQASTIFCSYTAWYVSDQVGNQNVCFLMTRLNYCFLTVLKRNLSIIYVIFRLLPNCQLSPFP